MEWVNEKFRCFECTILDYDRIIDIQKSRTLVHGVKKNAKHRDYMEMYVADLLLGKIKHKKILAIEELSTGRMTVYTIVFHPPAADTMFLLFGEIANDGKMFGFDSGVDFLYESAVLDAASVGRFNSYCASQIVGFLPVMKLSKERKKNVLDWYLHKIVHPQDSLDGIIEKTLLGGTLMERKHPVTIIHMVLKMKYRYQYFKNNGLNDNVLKKYFD